MEEFPEFRVGEFVIDAKLGEGGMGAVYKAKQTGLDRYVAIKVLPPAASANPEFIARFEREAKAAAAIVHPNIIQIYTIGRSQERPYFAMEFVEGRDLEQLIQSQTHAPNLRETVEIIKSCCNALAVAADRSITHRDIKPANIMIDLNGTVKVMDFGLARISDAGQNKLTMEGTVMGTPNYMPPEQGLGEAVDSRADQYSLGCVLYEMLTGQPVFSAQSMAQILYKHIYEKAKPVDSLRPDLPAGLGAICHRMIEKKREDRYGHPTEIIKALDQLQFGPETAPPDLRTKVRAAREDAVRTKPAKDRKALSMELSQDMTLMSLVGPLGFQEPNARTQQGGQYAQTLLTRGPSGALSMPNTGGGALSMPNAVNASGALSMAGAPIDTKASTVQQVNTRMDTVRQPGGDGLTMAETMKTKTTQVRTTDTRPTAAGAPSTSNALSLVGSTTSITVSDGPATGSAGGAKKSNLGLIVGVVVALLVVAGGAAWFLMAKPAATGGATTGGGGTGGGATTVLVPFSKLPPLPEGIDARLKIDGRDIPLPTADSAQDPHKNYALAFSKKGYQELVIPLTLDAQRGVAPNLAQIKVELKPTAELQDAYDQGVAKQTAGALPEAKQLFAQVVALDPGFKDAQARLAAVTKLAADQAHAGKAALAAAQKAFDSRQWKLVAPELTAIAADSPLQAQAQELLKHAQQKQQELDVAVQEIGLDLGNGKFGAAEKELVSAATKAPADDPTLKDLAAKLKTAKDAFDKGNQLYYDSQYEAAKEQFEAAQKIAPNSDEIKDRLRKIEMALKPTGETGQLIREAQDAIAAGNFTKASDRLKKIPDDYQDLPLIVNLNNEALRGLNRKSIEDFLVSLDKAYVSGEDRELKRHLTLRPDNELAALERALTDFDKELKFNRSEHALVKLAFLDRGGRQAKVQARWRYDVDSLGYKARLKGELPQEFMLILEGGAWQITAVKTGEEAQGAEAGGETPAPAPSTVEGTPPLTRLVGRITALGTQTVVTGDDPAKLVTATGADTVTVSLTREQIDHAMQGQVGARLVFDIYTPDKVVTFPLSKVSAVVEGKYVGAVRVDSPLDDQTICVVQDGKIEDFKVGMTAVQSVSRSGLPKMPRPSGVAVTKAAVMSNDAVIIKVTVLNPENAIVHYNWTAEGGGFRFDRTDLATNQWFPPVAAGKYKIRVEAESVYGQKTKMAEFTLESKGPDVDHRPRSLTAYSAGHQPGFGLTLGLCFDETNNGYVITQKEQSYTFSLVTTGLVNFADVSLMRQEDAESLKLLVSGEQVYALNRKANTVQSFGLKDNLFVNPPAAAVTYGGVGQGAGKYQTANDIVITPLGEVAILDATARTVSLFTRGGRYIMSFGSFGQNQGQLDKPVALTVDSRGHAFVLDNGRKLVIHFDGGRMVREIKFDTGADAKQQQLTHLAIDYGSGRLFVLDTGLNRIYAVDTATGEWLQKVQFGGGANGLEKLAQTQEIAVDRTGRVYVVSAGGAVIQKYSGDGEFLGRVGSTPAPAGSFTDLAINADGSGWLLNAKAKTVIRLSTDGLQTHELGAGQLQNPVAIASDGQGRLLVLDTGLQGGSVARFDDLTKAPTVLLAGQCATGIDLSVAGNRGLVLLQGGSGLLVDLDKDAAGAKLALTGGTQAAVDYSGQVYYFAGGQVHLIKADATPGDNWQVAFKSLGSLCASPSGMVFAVDATNKQLTGVDSRAGQATLTAPSPAGCAEPVAVGVDRLGHVYLLDGATGGVVRYIPNPGQ